MSNNMQNASNQAPTAPHTSLNPWLIMALISIPVFIGSLDLTVVSAFLPDLIVELNLPFNTALDDAAWIVTGYLLAYTVSLTFMGRVSDLIGRRATYLACLLIFMVGSLLVATAHQAPSDLLFQFYRRIGQRPDMPYVELQVIVLARVIQAIGAGALVPVSLALVGDLFPPERRAAALGLVGALDTLGWVLGHLYGGVLVQIMPWQGLFWINIPITLVALFAVTYALRNVPQQRVKGRFDFIGTALIVGALACLNIGLGSNIEVSGFSGNFEDLSPLPAYAAPVLGAGALMFIGFLLVESRVRDPLIKLGMFRRRNLSLAALVNLFVGYCLFIGLVSVPLLVNIRQESAAQLREAALEVGILLSALTIPMALAAIPGGWLSDRIGIRWTVVIGLTASLVGFFIKWQTWTLDIDNLMLALNMALIGIGIGLTFSPISTAIINSAYDEERGVASALVIILRLIGMTISVSTLSTFGLYRVTMIAGAAPASLDANAMLNVYADATLTVLGEMGLIGAILCALALIPAFFLGRTAAPPPRKVDVE
jgi:MFS family permease